MTNREIAERCVKGALPRNREGYLVIVSISKFEDIVSELIELCTEHILELDNIPVLNTTLFQTSFSYLCHKYQCNTG